ncbi:MAG: hypothetical protein DRP79_04370 [Planctomycetota bacterium]|nr:MAG: hypothetical protein DRP79_04370 [Planctomycetota bacterium]
MSRTFSETTELQDYYELLNISRTACSKEIKRSFRNMAKQYHPDRNSRRVKWAAKKTRLLIEAYRVLTDTRKRLEYDMMLQRDPEEARKRFWSKWEKARREDSSVGGKLKLVLHYLLTDRGADAVDLYEQVRSRNRRLDLSKHLDERDYMDCLFLLAEEFERMDNMPAALARYQEMYETLRKKPPGAYLHAEVRNRLYVMLTRGLPRAAGKKESVQYYISALELKLSKSERAFIYKKLAESYLALGQRDKAVASLSKALHLKPGLKGVKKIKESLDFDPDSPQAALKMNAANADLNNNRPTRGTTNVSTK